MNATGPLVAADETFNHQITDTFATVSQTDRSWTEKVCAMACARDGSLQVAFGMGKYTNRGMLDAYAGISEGVRQMTVRASRPLADDPNCTSVGPIRYEVLEPLKTVRFGLEANEVVPISFEWTFHSALPARLENREVHRSPDGYRLDADIVRYHQIGTGSGWVEVEGRRVDIGSSSWVSTRDHSWGVRYMVGAPVPDAVTRPSPDGLASLVMWSPILCERDDGSRYGLHWFYQRHRLPGWQRLELQGGVEHPDGSWEPFASAEPELVFDDRNRRLRGGRITFAADGGTTRVVVIKPVSDTGFHLGAGLYFGFDGKWHGQWAPRLRVEGEILDDCSEPDVARRVHQMRDCVVHVNDPGGGGAGWGNLQSIATGPDPEAGLSADASFL